MFSISRCKLVLRVPYACAWGKRSVNEDKPCVCVSCNEGTEHQCWLTIFNVKGDSQLRTTMIKNALRVNVVETI